MTHYRQPIDWTADRLVDARKMLRDWIEYCLGVEPDATPPLGIIAALNDDLNTPSALSVLHELSRGGRSHLDVRKAGELASSLRFLGLWNGEPSLDIYSYGYEVTSGPSKLDIQPRIDARAAARKSRNFAEADRIRDELDAMGIQLKDSKDSETGELVTTWEVKR
jgi:cysteinyl-tRNA synthetase